MVGTEKQPKQQIRVYVPQDLYDRLWQERVNTRVNLSAQFEKMAREKFAALDAAANRPKAG